MLKLRDLYTQVETQPIVSSGTTLGESIIQYEVRAYTDTRNLVQTKAYVVTCTQRLMVPNTSGFAASAGSVGMYNDYPALITASISIADPGKVIASQQLLDYFPRTLNTSVATTLNTGQSSGNSITQQYTSGSSTAQTNSFGNSESAGFFGMGLTGSLSHDRSSSTTTEQSVAASYGGSVDTSSQLSNASSMSIKDWGSYAHVNAATAEVGWVWGQEYPWNVIQFKSLAPSQSGIALPTFVQQRLVDEDGQVYPPSELSLFGVDFTSRAAWLITPSSGLTGNETIQFTHAITCGSASHGLNEGKLTVALDTVTAQPLESTSLDLAQLALDPLRGSRPAVVGFVANRFDVAPTPSGSAFAIASDANDLLVRGNGFTSVMGTDFSAGTVQMTVYFKVTEPNRDLSLSLKNWIQGTTPCQLTVVVNGEATLTRFVDVSESGSGGENVTVVALRYKDFTSVNYCDYLRMGLNTVSITVTPVTAHASTSYQILALAVG